jgi:hypothetical protein
MRRQCEKCPWKKSTNPLEIPGGYDVEKHKRLENTIAPDVDVQLRDFPGDELHVMACHESRPGREVACVGWLYNQLNAGNNLALRLAVMRGKVSADIQVVGPQHTCLADTLPK